MRKEKVDEAIKAHSTLEHLNVYTYNFDEFLDKHFNTAWEYVKDKFIQRLSNKIDRGEISYTYKEYDSSVLPPIDALRDYINKPSYIYCNVDEQRIYTSITLFVPNSGTLVLTPYIGTAKRGRYYNKNKSKRMLDRFNLRVGIQVAFKQAMEDYLLKMMKKYNVIKFKKMKRVW